MSRVPPKILGILLMAILIASIIPGATAYSNEPPMVATAHIAARVRSGPAPGYPQIGLLQAEDNVPLHGRTQDFTWYYIEYTPGLSGWVASWLMDVDGDISALAIVGNGGEEIPAPNPPVTQETPPLPAGALQGTLLTNLNLRPQPSVDNVPIGTIPGATVVPVLGRNQSATWLLVSYQGEQGWVSQPYVQLLTGTASSLPVSDDGTIDVLPSPPVEVPQITPIGSAHGATVILTGIGPNTHTIFEQGQQLGNYPHRFTRVGDSELALPETLTGFDGNSYYLGDWTNLQDTIQFFHGSFNRPSEAAVYGQTVLTLVDPFWANPNLCLPGENRLECEYRRFKPSVAFILLRLHGGTEDWKEIYRANMERVIETTLDDGIIPVLVLQFRFNDVPAASDEMNEILRELGEQYQIPVWDLFASTINLPDHGVDPTNHLTISPYNNFDFSNADNRQYGKVIFNLEALQILDILMHQVILQQ